MDAIEKQPARSSTFEMPSILECAVFILPVLAALLYRTYSYSLGNTALDLLRHLGIIFLIVELAVVVAAARRGWSPYSQWRSLPASSRGLVAFFLATFWISSVFISQHSAASLVYAARWPLHLTFLGSLFYLAPRLSEECVFRLAIAAVAALFVNIMIAAVHISSAPVHLDVRLDASVPGFISARLFGAWAGCVLTLLASILWFSAPNEKRQRLLYIAMGFAGFAACWSGTRAALLGFLFALAVGFAITRSRPPEGFFWKSALCATCAFALAVSLAPDSPQFQLFNSIQELSADRISSGRDQIWVAALAALSTEPFLGHGSISAFWLAGLENGTFHIQPHNALIQFWLSWGYPAGSAALMLMGLAVYAAHRSALRSCELIPLVVTLDALLVMSMFDGMLFFSRFVMLIFGLIALILTNGSEKPHGSQISHR